MADPSTSQINAASPQRWGTTTETRAQIIENMNTTILVRLQRRPFFHYVMVVRANQAGEQPALYRAHGSVSERPVTNIDGYGLELCGHPSGNARDALTELFEASCELLRDFPPDPRSDPEWIPLPDSGGGWRFLNHPAPLQHYGVEATMTLPPQPTVNGPVPQRLPVQSAQPMFNGPILSNELNGSATPNGLTWPDEGDEADRAG